MIVQKITGEGVTGVTLNLGLADMFAAATMSKCLTEVIVNREAIKRYDAIPYDQRKELTRPNKIEISDETLKGLKTFFEKVSLSLSSSDMFTENLEEL